MYNKNNSTIYPANSYAFQKQVYDLFCLSYYKPEVDFAWDGTPTLVYDVTTRDPHFSVEFGRMEEVPGGRWLLIYYTAPGELWFYPGEEEGITAELITGEGEKVQRWTFPDMSGMDFWTESLSLMEEVEKAYYQDQED